MPTLEDLKEEACFRRERVPVSLQELRSDILAFFGWSPDRIGIIGDHRHLSGYHRSREWIRESEHCTNRSYSVTETDGNVAGGDSRCIAAMDILTNQAHARAMHVRLNTARLSGRFPELRQVILESNPWHVHISFDRGEVEENHDNILAIITNSDHSGDSMITVNARMPELKQGSEGTHVTTWQALLNRHGAELKVDGEFGPLTDEATRQIQGRFGAEHVDGQVGPETWVIGLAGEDQV